MLSVIGWVIGLSLAGGTTCLIAYAASMPVRNKIRTSWLYYLWLIALIRFIIPVPLNLPYMSDGVKTVSAFIASALAEQENHPDTPEDGGTEIHAPNISAANTGHTGSPAMPAAYNAHFNEPHSSAGASAEENAADGSPGVKRTDIRLLSLLPHIWLAGTSSMFLWTVAGYILTVRRLRHGRALLTPGRIPVYESRDIKTPVLVGVIRPIIYLPPGFINPELAVSHEMTHLRRGDLWLKWLLQLTVCIHWFNPLVYLMKRELNRLTELACDSAVVRRLDTTQRREYGQMLLDTAKDVAGRNGMMIAGLAADKKMFKERLKEIMEYGKLSGKSTAVMSVLVVCVLSAAILCGVFLTGCTAPPVESSDEANITKAEEPTAATDTAQPIEPANNTDAAVISIKLDLPFINDPGVIGTWEMLNMDIVEIEDNIDSGTRVAKGTIDSFQPQAEIVFAENGVTNVPDWTWSNGSIISSYSGEILSYRIQDINGNKVMYLEKPYTDEIPYFILEWSSASTEFNIRTDEIDLPFVDDPAVIGTWECVDYVENISDFNTEKTSFKELLLREMTFSENGALSSVSDKGPLEDWCLWTKGIVISPYMKTAGAYEIKEIEGSTYLFFEFKNGDYSYRDMEPWYYVLVKSS